MTSLLANRIATLVRAGAAARSMAATAPLQQQRIPACASSPPPRRHHGQASSSSSSSSSALRDRPAVVVIVGATGTGKTKLSIDAALALGGEVVNADKIQLYAGLDVTTNKVAPADRRGVPHHLLGAIRPDAGALPPSAFRSLAAATAAAIAARRRVPVVAGGSNSLIHALLADDRFAHDDPFAAAAAQEQEYRPAPRFPCCLLWVHVDAALLDAYLDRRVDDMVRGGMVEELRAYFASTTPAERAAHAPGLGKAIGVPELGAHLAGRATFRAAVRDIKAHTRDLAAAQVAKIRRMARGWGWPVLRLDASAAVSARLNGAGAGAEAQAWERDVRGPGIAAIRSFLRDHQHQHHGGVNIGDQEEAEAVRCCCDVVG
ncbi:hypothetical protein BS78_09G227000 [Paspalum vaginatum]|nr:hypothetical protein BS78_09G227000 [Paspalum vaginatum]